MLSKGEEEEWEIAVHERWGPQKKARRDTADVISTTVVRVSIGMRQKWKQAVGEAQAT